jgi:perosamine synthetase
MLIEEKIIIPVYRPYLHGNEKKYVNDCLDSSWISSKGEYIDQFEEAFAAFVDCKYAISVCNGTVALHLALVALGIQPGDEVIVPSLTYVASVNAISYMGATPVFVDSLSSTWQINPSDVRRKITSKTKAIMAVHLYGHPSDLKQLREICDEHNLYLIEDCAEAFGSWFQGKHVGNHGEIATFSFFGNKSVTTGEGGMVVTNDPILFERASLFKNQGNSPKKAYWHEVIGYNYRMTNLAAAIGLAQMEQAEKILTRKKAVARYYEENLSGLPLQFHQESLDCTHSYWMVSFLVESALVRDELRNSLLSMGIETRPFFSPIHTLPMYLSSDPFPVAEDLSLRGVNLPSFPDLTPAELEWICSAIKRFYA